MLRTLATFLSAWLLAALIAVSPAGAERRLALVIGNDDYAYITRLQKAVNDAEAMAGALASLGFEVIRATNTTRREMNAALSQFVSAIGKGDTAMLFYAGHGVEIEGKNYLLPVDIPDAGTADAGFIEAESLSLDDIIARLKSRSAGLNLLVLDACRNNPFTNPAARSLASGRGLARISAPQGTFVMYSADVGEAALDRLGEEDRNPNSVFTRELIPLLGQPDLDLVDMAREVRRRVRKLALTVRHEQTPAYYDAVLGDFFFAREGEASPSADEPRQHASLPPAADAGPSREPEAEPAPLAGRALVVTAGEKDSIRLWDPVTASLIAELEGEKITLSAVHLTGSGRSLAVAATDGALFSYAIPGFKKQNALYPGFRVTSIAEAPDGTLVLGGEDGTMAVVDGRTFEVVWKARNHAGIVSPILVAGDGDTAVTASADGTIAEIRLADGAVIHRVATLAGKSITDIANLSAAVVIAVHEDGTIAHINLRNGRIMAAFAGHRGWISSVEVLEGGDYVTAGVDGTLSFWTLGSDRPSRNLKAHGDVASGAKLMRFGGRPHLLSTGFDGSARIWDAEGGKLQADMPHGSAILYFDYASQG